MKRKEQVAHQEIKKNQERTNPTVSELHYQFVFCVRYRRKIFTEFKEEQIESRFKQLIEEIGFEHGFSIKECRCEPDYVYLDVQATPSLSPADIMAKIKGNTSRILRTEIQGLSHLQGLWTRSFYVTTKSEIDDEVLTNFLAQQKIRC